MMKTTLSKLLLKLTLLFWVLQPMAASAAEVKTAEGSSSSPFFEYKILGVSKYAARQDLEEELNRLGKLGWKIEAVERVVFGGMRDTLEIFLSREKVKHEK